MRKYKTEDGQIFADEDKAVTNAKMIDYKRQGLEVCGKPYEYSKIEWIES